LIHGDYCSLWDRNYCAKGLALYESLAKHSSEPFTLHVLAMCTQTEKILNELALPNLHVMSLAAFELALNLKPIREGRSWAEYCWTVASSLMEYLMPWVGPEGITYLDSDLMFFSDPKAIFNELGERSLAIIPHRFPEPKRHMERNGVFNVGWVTGRNTEAGRRCITRWAAQCREWCFNRNEGGKFGDQSYLDSWPTDLPGEVAIIENVGAGLAPWNIANYRLSASGDITMVDDRALVFYHFHEFVDEKFLTGYELRSEDLALIYCPYVTAWTEAKRTIQEVEQKFVDRKLEIEKQWETA
jgi:hypothetical protein